MTNMLSTRLLGLGLCGAFAYTMLATGCGADDNPSLFDDAGNGNKIDAGGKCGITGCVGGDAGDGGRACIGLECDVPKTCASGPSATSIRGAVYDPSGKLPLYNVIVYVPQTRDPLPPLVNGATCDRCGALAQSPVASALTDEKGEFLLSGIPAGNDIPLVIQVGKWRKQLKLKIDACKEHTFNAKDASNRETVMRLPGKQSEGEMPQIAISTGTADPLPCLLPRMGIDASEFTAPTGNGKVHVFKGNGGNISGVTGNDADKTLWNSVANLKKYDMVMLSCEGGERNETKSAGDKTNLRDYLDTGGRVFATHYHYTWFKNGPDDVKSVATWGSTQGADNATNTYAIDTSFPKGMSFGKWLQNVSASADGANITLNDVAKSVSDTNAKSLNWISKPNDTYKVKYMSFNTPVAKPVDEQCGKAVLSDIHVSAGADASNPPVSCGNADLTAQEKALVFLLMDLSSCVQNDREKPKQPEGPK